MQIKHLPITVSQVSVYSYYQFKPQVNYTYIYTCIQAIAIIIIIIRTYKAACVHLIMCDIYDYSLLIVCKISPVYCMLKYQKDIICVMVWLHPNMLY